MRRPLLFAAATIAAALVLAACGDDSTTHDGMPGMGTTMMGRNNGMGHRDNSPVAGGARRIEVGATSFAFDPDEITVEAGENIAIELTSDDVEHDFTIDELDAHISAPAGETAEGGFRADEAGRYTFYCTVAGHRDAGMEGTLVVE